MTDTILLYARFTWGFGCICAGMLLEFAAELHSRSGDVLRQWAERVIEHGLEIGVWD